MGTDLRYCRVCLMSALQLAAANAVLGLPEAIKRDFPNYCFRVGTAHYEVGFGLLVLGACPP